jgi:hypothetical protein
LAAQECPMVGNDFGLRIALITYVAKIVRWMETTSNVHSVEFRGSQMKKD